MPRRTWTVMIDPALHDWLYDEAARQQMKEHKRVSASDVLERIIKDYQKKNPR